MIKLERNSPLTLTYQLTEILKKRLDSEYSPGQLFPGEKALMSEFGVSSITVRNALNNLVVEGKINRSPGKGSFVSEKKITSNITHLQSGTSLLNRHFSNSTISIIESGYIGANEYESSIFKLNEGSPLGKLVRLRKVENEPYCIEISVIPKEICPELIEKYKGGSLYGFLRKEFNLRMTYSEEKYAAVALDDDYSSILAQKKGTPAMKLNGHVYDQKNRLVCLEESYYRSDKFEIAVTANSKE